jgi:hypothetical protein
MLHVMWRLVVITLRVMFRREERDDYSEIA